jgi:hypothetical protein
MLREHSVVFRVFTRWRWAPGRTRQSVGRFGKGPAYRVLDSVSSFAHVSGTRVACGMRHGKWTHFPRRRSNLEFWRRYCPLCRANATRLHQSPARGPFWKYTLEARMQLLLLSDIRGTEGMVEKASTPEGLGNGRTIGVAAQDPDTCSESTDEPPHCRIFIATRQQHISSADHQTI